MQFYKYTNTHIYTYVSLIPPREDQCEWHRMSRMAGPDCPVMCNLINTLTHTQTHTPAHMQTNHTQTLSPHQITLNMTSYHTKPHTIPTRKRTEKNNAIRKFRPDARAQKKLRALIFIGNGSVRGGNIPVNNGLLAYFSVLGDQVCHRFFRNLH